MSSRGEKRVLLKGGTIVDPATSFSGPKDILLSEGKISAVDKPGSFSGAADVEVLDVAGQLIVPGLVDIHVHLREPGQEWKETILTGCRAAVAGGFTTICCMPNTVPANDSASVTDYILAKAAAANLCRVLPIGAITKGREGKELAPLLELREAGCVAFSDDGAPVYSSQIMRRALEYNLMLGAVLTVHEEDLELSDGFSMNESAMSLRLGLKGMPAAAEDIMIARDIELSRLTGGRVHFCHVSTARGVLLIKRAKEDGINVTAEVTPQHISITEDAIGWFDTAAKMSMPLRTAKDVEALLAGLADGVIDCIASDHAPHEADSKAKEFDHASFGMLGLQTTVPLTMARVRSGSLSLIRAVEALTTAPSRCFNLTQPKLAAGAQADITVIDPERKATVSADSIRSKSKNTPFLGLELQGHATKTFIAGRQVYDIDLNE